MGPITRMTDSKASISKQGVKNVQEILKKEIDIDPVSTETAKVKDNDNENEKGAKELRRLLTEERSAKSNIIKLESKETEKITGTIRLNIQKARDLKNLDIVGKSDPYVVIKCGDQKSKSKKRKNTLNPEWNFSTDISLNGPDNSIFLEIFDKDKIGKDESMGSRTIDNDTLHLLRTKGATWLKLDDNTPGEVLISGDFSAVQLISSKQSTIETSNKKSEKVSQDSKTTGVPEHQKTTSDQNIAIRKESGGAKEVKHLLENAESQVNEDTQGGTVQIGASKTTQNVSKVITSQSSSEIINQVSSSQTSDIRQISHEVTDNNTNISSAKESLIIPKMGVDGQSQSFTSVTTSVAESSQLAHQVNTKATLELSSSIVHQVSSLNPVQNTSQLSHQVTDNSKDTTSSVSHTVIQSVQLETANYPLQDNIETLTEPTHSVSSLDTYSQVAHQVTEGSDHTSSSPQLQHSDREGAASSASQQVTSSSNDIQTSIIAHQAPNITEDRRTEIVNPITTMGSDTSAVGHQVQDPEASKSSSDFIPSLVTHMTSDSQLDKNISSVAHKKDDDNVIKSVTKTTTDEFELPKAKNKKDNNDIVESATTATTKDNINLKRDVKPELALKTKILLVNLIHLQQSNMETQDLNLLPKRTRIIQNGILKLTLRSMKIILKTSRSSCLIKIKLERMIP